MAALHFLGDAQAARDAWDAATGAPFWKDASARQREIFDTLGNPDAGLPAGHDLWFSSPWFNAMVATSRDSRAGQAGAARRWDAHIDECDAHTDYLLRAAELGDEAVRHLALSVLKRRAQHTDVSALAALRRLLTRPRGTDQVRDDLLRWLTDQNLVGQDEPVEAWLQGRLIKVQSRGVHITTEPPASPFAPPGTALQGRVHAAISRRALDEALELAQQLLQMHPEEPVALVNVATIQEGRGHPIAECIGYYRQAHALAPDHLFARFGLARCLALQGQLDEARALLNGYLDRSHWHVSDYNCFLLARHALALASGRHESARDLKATMDDLQHRFPA